MQRVPARVMSMILLTLVLSTAIVQGGGLIEALPKDGAWTKFNLAFERTSASGRIVRRQETMTVSSVGEKQVEGKACRWIGIAHGGIHRPIGGMVQETTDVDSFLIPEEVFSMDTDPLTKAVEMQRQASHYENGTPTKVDRRDQRQERHIQVDLHQFVHGKPKEPRELPAKINDSKLGKKECTGIAYEDTITLKGGSRYETKYEVWQHQDAPFGVVEMNIERRLFRNDELQLTEISKLTLSDFGDDAKQVIKE